MYSVHIVIEDTPEYHASLYFRVLSTALLARSRAAIPGTPKPDIIDAQYKLTNTLLASITDPAPINASSELSSET